MWKVCKGFSIDGRFLGNFFLIFMICFRIFCEWINVCFVVLFKKVCW